MKIDNELYIKIGKILDEIYMEYNIINNKCSFEVLEIYFNKKSQENKEKILRDSAFGC